MVGCTIIKPKFFNLLDNQLKYIIQPISRRNQQQQPKHANPLLSIHLEREKERQKEKDRERYVIMRQSQRHAQLQNQKPTQHEENIYENTGDCRNVIHGVHIPPF